MTLEFRDVAPKPSLDIKSIGVVLEDNKRALQAVFIRSSGFSE
jgi:hypothetical protein